MFDEEFDREYNEELNELKSRYERMKREGKTAFFDLDELDMLIEYYMMERNFGTVNDLVDYGSELYPGNLKLKIRHAMVLAESGQRAKALAQLKKILAGNPANPEIHYWLASVYSMSREHSAAVRHLREALRYASEPEEIADIKRSMTAEYIEMERFDEAIEILKEALAEEPDNEMVLHDLDYCYGQTGRHKEAIHLFEQFVDNHPYNFGAWFSLGNAYLADDQLEEAVKAFDFCLTIEENFSPALFNMANALIQLGHYRDAIENLNAVMEFEKEFPDPEIFCLVGECYEKLEEYLAAHDYYNKALEIMPDNSDALIGLAVVYQSLDKAEKALKFADKAIKFNSHVAEYHYIKADILKEIERYDEAFAIFQSLPGEELENKVYWLDLSDLYFETGNVAMALDTCEEGLLHLHGNSSLETRKAIYLIHKGHIKEGVKRLEVIFEIDSKMIAEALDYDEDLATISTLKPYFKQIES
jgi:tetratricopeptide (TPR) repeat protein